MVAEETVGDDTVVPGHLAMAPLVSSIATEQARAPEDERGRWTGTGYTTAVLAGRTLYLYKGRLIVPTSAVILKETLMRLAHEGSMHYTGAARTLWALTKQARVHWVGIDTDVAKWVQSCYRCAFAKSAHGKVSDIGTLSPTVAPRIHYTWYADLKGPMPFDTGYILVIIESLSRMCRLRYIPNCTAKEVCEELTEVFAIFGTRPVQLRTDNGPPFDSGELLDFCKREGVRVVHGAPYHSQGQGMVESKIRKIAEAIIAMLGNKAEREWFKGSTLTRIEEIANSSVIEHQGGSPYWIMSAREPRTQLAGVVSWDEYLNVPGVSTNDISEFVAEYHDAIRAVEQLSLTGTSVQQALVKRRWDSGRDVGTFAIGDYVLVLAAAPNRLRSYRTGPYKITRVSADGNFVWGALFVDPKQTEAGPFHVTRLAEIDMSRASVPEIAAYQLEAGSAYVVAVRAHRVLASGAYEFEIEWLGDNKPTSWIPSQNVRQVSKVIEYCSAHGLKAPGTEVDVGARGAPRGRGRGRATGTRGGALN